MSADLRTTFLDFDARRTPKTDHSCVCCSRDLDPEQPYLVVWIVRNGDPFVIDPEDVAAGHPGAEGACKHPIGVACARKLGLRWTRRPGVAPHEHRVLRNPGGGPKYLGIECCCGWAYRQNGCTMRQLVTEWERHVKAAEGVQRG